MTDQELSAFRRRIGDKPKPNQETFTATGGSGVFDLAYSGVGSVVVTVDGVLKTVTTDYTVDADAGTVTFVPGKIPPDGAVVSVQYVYCAFTDQELTDLFNEYGLTGGVIEAIRELLANSAKLYDYTQGATEAKLSQVFSNLEKLLNSYIKAADDGGYVDEDGNAIGGVTIGKRTNPDNRTESSPTLEDLSRSDRLY